METGQKGVVKAVMVTALAVIGTVALSLRPAIAGMCDNWPGLGYCCQEDGQCYSGSCVEEATGYCSLLSMTNRIDQPRYIYSVCQSDGECDSGFNTFCVTYGQCYDASGQPTGQGCIVGGSNPYCCFWSELIQPPVWYRYYYVTCDDDHPCQECCDQHSCSSGACGSEPCNEGEQCLPCTCVDNDGDGYGNPASPACAHPELDCDDTNPDVHPGAIEECGGPTCSDGLDNDCNGLADSKDPACKQWCPRQVQGSTVDSNRTVSRAPVALFAALVLPPCAILVWKGLRRRR
jgi:hypothetical protein